MDAHRLPPDEERHAPRRRRVTFRFYAELNDFLPSARRQRSFLHTFTGTPAVKDVIEALGVPHADVDLILVDGVSVGFGRKLAGGERVAVYPVFERFDVGPVVRLRAQPLRQTRFVLDVHLGRLARYLRMLGFDARYRNDYADPEIVRLAHAERRIILTRDLGLLKHGAGTHGYFVRATDPHAQLREVVAAFDLHAQFSPFTRCLACNGTLVPAPEQAVRALVPPRVQDEHDAFLQCRQCRKVYWPGSHYDRMAAMIDALAQGG